MELTDWVPWVVSALAVPQTLLMRHKRRSAWLWSALGCVICAVYTAATGQYGFIPVNLFFLVTNVWNYFKWKKDDMETVQQTQDREVVG